VRELSGDGQGRTRTLPAVKGLFLLIIVATLGLAACGGTKSSSPTATQTLPPTSTAAAKPAPTTTQAAGPGALPAEANSAAAGDIPDNQVFLVFHNGAAGYSMKYPEGWAQRGAGKQVTFRDKNNIVRVVVATGAPPTASNVRSELRALPGVTLKGAPQRTALAGKPAVRVTYTTVSAPNAVTGKRVKLVVDRYYLWNGRRRAIVDLGTPMGVDNVDAYRLMIESFRWS
jgi:hypothetical protein